MRANVEEILVLQEVGLDELGAPISTLTRSLQQEISDLRLENARLKERLAKAEEVILTAFVSEETPDSE
jgi:regulator of replication initiation timing